MTDQPTQEGSPPPRKPATVGAELVDRRNRVIEMRNRGVTWHAIADELGYDSAASAAQDMRRALDQRRAELALSLDQYRERQLAGIDMQRRAVVSVLEARHYVVNAGEIVRGEDGATPLEDDAPVLRAVEMLKRLDEREARLLGLDAPQSVTGNVVVNYTIAGVPPEALT